MQTRPPTHEELALDCFKFLVQVYSIGPSNLLDLAALSNQVVIRFDRTAPEYGPLKLAGTEAEGQ